jgi:hypothetical protein
MVIILSISSRKCGICPLSLIVSYPQANYRMQGAGTSLAKLKEIRTCISSSKELIGFGSHVEGINPLIILIGR